MVIGTRIDMFIEPDAFKREMDQYVQRTGQLEPLEGHVEAFLAGDIEAARERQYREEGVPLRAKHRN